MSSIRERAAALNLAEKLCVRPPACGASSSQPVQGAAAAAWSSLISLLRTNVTVKRRRLHLKSHGECFLGSEAADVLLEHVAHIRGLQGASVSRDKVVCVCQALLDCGVFEAVGTKVFGKEKKREEFQDSRGALYRFVDARSPSVDELEKGALGAGLHKLFCTAPPDRPEDQLSPCGSHLVQTSTPLRLTVEPQMENLSLSPSRAKTDSPLPPSLVEKVWQEQTLLRLLNLVELPLLEGVLQCIQGPAPPAHWSPPGPAPSAHWSPPGPAPPAHSDPDLLCCSNQLDRNILQNFRDSQEDEWLRAALEVLDFLPDQLVAPLSRELPHRFPGDQRGGDRDPAGGDERPPAPGAAARYKLLLFDTLAKHYGAARTSLLPHSMSDVYAAITQLLVAARLNRALEALQLSLKLLPPRRREELRLLLTFMSVAADWDQVRLDPEEENRLVVRRSFSRAVVHSRTLSRDQEDLLLGFMLCNVHDIFKIPGALHKHVSEILAGLVPGNQPDVTGSAPFQQDCSTTQQELQSLLTSIHLNPRTPSKERRRLLRQFHQAHPQIFYQYFGDSAHSFL